MDISSRICIYVDVDDTFVRSAGSKRMPMTSVIEHIRALHANGAILYCWSAGGAEYARQSAEEFGVAHCFADFLPKPNVLLDDMSPSQWPRCIQVHPSTCSSDTLDEYRKRLG